MENTCIDCTLEESILDWSFLFLQEKGYTELKDIYFCILCIDIRGLLITEYLDPFLITFFASMVELHTEDLYGSMVLLMHSEQRRGGCRYCRLLLRWTRCRQGSQIFKHL